MINVCIIGAGGIAQTHADAFKKNSRVNIQAVCDIDEKRVNEFADKYSIKGRYTSLEEMLKSEKGLDAASVCVWTADHASSTVMALNAGLHVLCEKPVARNAIEAQQMVDAAKKNNKLLMIAFPRRFEPKTLVAKEMIEKGTLGDVYLTKGHYMRRTGPGRWFTNKEFSGGGPVIDIGVHCIDQCRYLMGNPKPASVFAVTYDKTVGVEKNAADVYTVEDNGYAIIKYENGSSTILETSFYMHRSNGSFTEVAGTKAGIDILNDKINLHNEVDDFMMDSVVYWTHWSNRKPTFEAEIDHFVECIEDGTPCISPGEDGVTIMRIIDAIYESARTGELVRL